MTSRRLNLTSLPLRRWLALALAVGFVVPVFTTGVVAYHVIGLDNEPETAAPEFLSENASRWSDPEWQVAARNQLAAEGTDFVLVENGEEVYRSADDPLIGPDGEPRERVVESLVVSDGGSEQVAYIYSEQTGWPDDNTRFVVPIAAVASLLITLGGIAWFLGRMVVTPLGSTSIAARQVAAGNLDIELPSSRVREVAGLKESFEAMSAGLRESLEQQSRMEQDRRFLISAVAHDLRTPLFSLRGYLEGLERGVADTPEKRSEYLALAHEKADALERMIADLSEFTRLEYLDQAPNREPMDLIELLRRLVDGLQPQAQAKGLNLVLENPPATGRVSGDGHLITRAVENLLDNALRHTPAGGTIRVACDVNQRTACFTISDTGPGIPTVDLPHIFAPLYRGESSRSRRTGGAGLGLAIARRIMQAHDGDLTAGNSETGGAIFTGTLPVHQPGDAEQEMSNA